MEKQEEIGALYARLVAEGREVVRDGKYELVDAKGVEVLTYGGKSGKGRYAPVKYVSRHRTSKRLMEISVVFETRKAFTWAEENKTEKAVTSVVVTTDHVCMAYDRDRVLQNVRAEDLREGDYVSIYDAKASMREVMGTV